MKFDLDQQDILVVGMFLWLYDILTKTRTYPSLGLNLEFYVIL